MSSEIDPKIIKTSQELLSKIVKKPVITDKLLKRPPFRFIHDLVSNIIKTHGFMKDLYKEEEMIAENIKDKDSKIAYLQKAIDVMGFITGDIIAVKPSKIVAGLEADKTNQWLQILAKAVIDKKDSKDAVQRVLSGEKPTQQKSVAVSNANIKKKAINANTKQVNNTTTKTTTKSLQKEMKSDSKSKIKREASPLRSANKAKPNSPKEISDTSALNGSTSKPSSASDNRDNDINDETIHKEIVNGNATVDEIIVKNAQQEEATTPRARTVAKSAMRKDYNTTNEVAARPPTRQERAPRPSSSRPAPPRIMSKTIEDNKNVEAELEEKLRLLSAKPVENLITENLTNEEDDEFIVTDVIKPDEDDLDINQQLVFDNNNDLQKGSLVKQLVDTKKELEGNQSTDVTTKDKNLTRLANRDIEKLRQSIQSLSQCANPLGKVLDYLQEDIDAMVSELKSWQEIYKQNMAILEKSQTSTDDDLESYRAELNLLDSDINEQRDKISITKANLIRNEERIQKMVTTMNKTF